MTQYNVPIYKALYFDLRIQALAEHYSSNNPKGGYAKIQSFLTKHNFSHAQYSRYHSNHKTTDMNIFDLIKLMASELPWLPSCANHFEVTDIGDNYNLMDILISEPTKLV